MFSPQEHNTYDNINEVYLDMIAENKYDDTYALMTGWEVIDYVKKLRNVLEKLLSHLQQGTLVRDRKNRSNNINKNSCIFINYGR